MRYREGQQPEKLGQGLTSLHHTTKRLLSFKKREPDSIQLFESKVESLMASPDDKSYKDQVQVAYSILYRTYQDLIEEENLINRMEKKANIRNTFFRGLTTLIIGFSIMFVYWVASYFGIAMPLLKLPV